MKNNIDSVTYNDVINVKYDYRTPNSEFNKNLMKVFERYGIIPNANIERKKLKDMKKPKYSELNLDENRNSFENNVNLIFYTKLENKRRIIQKQAIFK